MCAILGVYGDVRTAVNVSCVSVLGMRSSANATLLGSSHGPLIQRRHTVQVTKSGLIVLQAEYASAWLPLLMITPLNRRKKHSLNFDFA